MANMYPRTCKICGASFAGGPRAFYCPTCRIEIMRERSRVSKQKERRGLTRQIGSIDLCVRCGKQYTVNSGIQKYCPDCKYEAIAEIDRKHGLEYYYDNKDIINPKRYEKRKVKEKQCRICGKLFDPGGTPKVTCSAKCKKELLKKHWRKAEEKRKGKNYEENN